MYQSKNDKINIYSIDFIKSTLPLVIVLPSLIGGFIQIISLSLIDITYVKFFSSSQVIQDALIILSTFSISIIIVFYILKIVDVLGYKYYKLFLCVIIICSLFFLKELNNNDSFELVLQIIFSASTLFSCLLAEIKFQQQGNYKVRYSIFILICIILFSASIESYFNIQKIEYEKLSHSNTNFIELEKKLRIKYKVNQDLKLDLKYFNQTYIFYEVKNEKNYLDNKIIIAKFSELLGEDKEDKKEK